MSRVCRDDVLDSIEKWTALARSELPLVRGMEYCRLCEACLVPVGDGIDMRLDCNACPLAMLGYPCLGLVRDGKISIWKQYQQRVSALSPDIAWLADVDSKDRNALLALMRQMLRNLRACLERMEAEALKDGSEGEA